MQHKFFSPGLRLLEKLGKELTSIHFLYLHFLQLVLFTASRTQSSDPRAQV